MFYFFTRARVVVCSARAPFFLSQILTSIETLFAFFCALRFFDLSISCVFDLPLCFAVENESVLRSKSAQKTRSSRKRSKRTVPFFSFFVLSLCSLVRDVTATVFVLAFSFLRTSSLSALVKFFLSLEGVEEDLPHIQEPPPLQKRCLFSL